MSRRQGPIYISWDSCVFFAWIKDEPLDDYIKKGIEQTIENAYSGQVVIVSSTITLSEVLQTKMTADQKEKYAQVFKHPSLQLVDVDRRIAAKAALIRANGYEVREIEAGIPATGPLGAIGLSTDQFVGIYADLSSKINEVISDGRDWRFAHPNPFGYEDAAVSDSASAMALSIRVAVLGSDYKPTVLVRMSLFRSTRATDCNTQNR